MVGPSYIKDTTHFLKTILDIPTPLPVNSILVTLDVTSLYTNIPHEEGISSAVNALYHTPYSPHTSYPPPPEPVFVTMLTYILKRNYFEFDNNFYLQKHGTAMGTRMAPAYANIFMSNLEQHLLANTPNNPKPIIWKRYIDVIFLIRTHGEPALEVFIQYLNSMHDTIKFQHEHSDKSINFLNCTIILTPQHTLKTSLYIKPTDRTVLLHNASHHPRSCKHGIIYSQALRYRRLITDDEVFFRHLQRLRTILLSRGYKDSDILPQFNRVYPLSQNDLLCNPSHNTKKSPTLCYPLPPRSPKHHTHTT